MFEVDRESNRIAPLIRRDLADLGIRERNHLQEWLAGRPDALGEDLLILQKEFEGFEHGRERLDLLALDRSGRLVVIENKLGACTRDVFGQVVPYAAYVSRLGAEDIVGLHQRYLGGIGSTRSAAQEIADFMGVAEVSAACLNPHGIPRIMIVARSFPAGVVTTVEWLNQLGIPTQCFEASALTRRDEVFFQCSPLAATNALAERAMQNVDTAPSRRRGAKPRGHPSLAQAFWIYAVPLLVDAGALPSGPSGDASSSGAIETRHGPVDLRLGLGRKRARVAITIPEATAEAERDALRRLAQVRPLLDRGLAGAALEFTGGVGRAMSIAASKPFDATDREQWPEITLWMSENSQKLIRVANSIEPIAP